ncbi:hypothetical protein L195_g050829, partial [Trifolium pratense]
KVVKKMNLLLLKFSAIFLKIRNLQLHKVQSFLVASQVQSFRFLFLRLHQILMVSPSPVSIPSIASDFDSFSIKIGEITCFLGYSCCSDVDFTITASEEDEKPKNLETEFVSYEVSMTLLNQSCVKAFSSPIKIKRQHDGNVRFSQDQDQDSKKGEPFSDLLLCSSESIIFVSHHHALGITVFDPGGFILVIYRSNIMLAVVSLFDSISLFPFDPGGIFLCHLCFPNSYHEFSYYEFEGGYYNIEVSSATYDSSFGYATLFKID